MKCQPEGNDPAVEAAAAAPEARETAFWRQDLTPYAKADNRRAALDIFTSVVPYLAGMALMYFALDVSYWLTLAIAVPTSGFLTRTFIVFHDCTHGSFVSSRRGNVWVGTAVGMLVMQPFENWRHAHAMHHATAGDLDRRGDGDVPTLTVDEYVSKPWLSRLGYRLFRHPAVMFTVGPVWSLVIGPRIWSAKQRPRLRRSVILTNVALLVLVGGVCMLIGWQAYLLIQGPTVVMGGAFGVWLFYVQHQYEDVYWERSDTWDYADAALQGSSYLKLPKVLQFFSGNIGLHHVHHLSAKVPNYNLQSAHDNCEMFHNVPVLTLRHALRCSRLKLWDERRGRLVTFGEAWASTKGRGSRRLASTA